MNVSLWKREVVRALAVFLFLLAQAAPGWAGSPAVFYTVDTSKGEAHFFHVTVRTETAGAASVAFQMPAWNGLYQIRDFAQRIRWVQAFDQDGVKLPVEKEDKETWRVTTRGAREVSLEYDIYANVAGPFDSQIDARHAFVNPAYVFMYVLGKKQLPLQVHFEVPSEWRIATELLSTPEQGTFEARNYDRFADSPVEMGAFQRLQFESHGAQFAVVIDGGDAQFDEQDLLQRLDRVVSTEMNLMQDVPFKHYTFFYHFPEGRSGGGMEHAYSTAIDESASEVSRSLNGLIRVSAHEFFHVWNVKRIRPSGLEPIDYTRENYSRDLWFSEGVTSLYGAYTLVRSGLDTREEFYRSLARTIQSEESRPAHLFQSAEESSLDAWLEKYPFYRLPENSISYYTKGEIIGLLLDLRIRALTDNRKSLDDVLRYLKAQDAKKGLFFDDRRGIADAVDNVAGTDFKDFFAKYVSGVDEIDYDSFLAAAGWKLRTETREVADFGITLAQNVDGAPLIQELAHGGAGQKAGLKAGDELLEIDGKPVTRPVFSILANWDAAKPMRVKVQRGRDELEVTMTPGTKASLHYSVVELPDPTPLEAAIRKGILSGP